MEEFLGTDMRLDGADLRLAPTGDVALATGRACLLQDLMGRLGTPKGDLWSHPNYGVDLPRFIHVEDTPLNRLDLEMAVVEAMEADPRVEPGSAQAHVVDWGRNTLKLEASFIPVGETNAVSLVLGYDLQEITLEAVIGFGA